MKNKNKSKNVFTICFNSTKLFTIIFVFLYIVQGIIPSVLTLLQANFINEILNQVFTKASISLVISYGIVILILIAIKWELGSIQQLISNLLISKVKMNVNLSVYEKKSKILFECFENKEICDLIFLTSEEPEKKIVNCFKNKMMLITDIITVISFIIILFPILSIKIWLLLLLVIPLLKISVKSGQNSYQTSKKLIIDKRKADTLFEMLNDKQSADERFTYNYSKKINKTGLDLNENVRRKEMKVRLKWFIRLKSSAIIIAVLTGILTIDMFFRVIAGVLTMGMFISMFNALNSLVGKMTWQITELTDQIAKDSAFVKDFNKFFELPENKKIDCLSDCLNKNSFEKLVFKNVSFHYPNSEKYVLKDFSFEFLKGKKYSIIGINGSGKSTLIKLMLGLYDNYSGSIEIDGTNLKNINKSNLYDFYSVVFQDFVQYQLSIDEVISLVETDDSLDKDKVYKMLNFDEIIDSLPKGTKSKIGKIYKSNLDLSYGQWQKLNIIRSLMKQAPIYILDEPTASLDPLGELEIYRQYLDIKSNETIILISHRLGITKDADIIVLLNDGKMAATGDHNSLYNGCALYKEMFDLQKEWYDYENY